MLGYLSMAGATWMLLILWLLDWDDVFGTHSPLPALAAE
jgi:hypothetical protein